MEALPPVEPPRVIEWSHDRLLGELALAEWFRDDTRANSIRFELWYRDITQPSELEAA
jgi:hypothetical protein